jgi:transcriptional regulator with XRE-family HTH domain
MISKMTMKRFESEENQALIRDRLFNIARSKKVTMKELAGLVGLVDVTITRFLRAGKDVDFKSLCMIEEFVNGMD